MTFPFVEPDCTVRHNGRSFSSGGAVVTEKHLIAYPGKNGALHDWHGRTIGSYRVISSRPAIFFGCRSWMGDTYYYMRATVKGRRYSLRGFGTGMIATGRALN